jgi:hypothetical protein
MNADAGTQYETFGINSTRPTKFACGACQRAGRGTDAVAVHTTRALCLLLGDWNALIPVAHRLWPRSRSRGLRYRVSKSPGLQGGLQIKLVLNVVDLTLLVPFPVSGDVSHVSRASDINEFGVARQRENAPDQTLSRRFMPLMILPVDASLSARQAPRRFQK